MKSSALLAFFLTTLNLTAFAQLTVDSQNKSSAPINSAETSETINEPYVNKQKDTVVHVEESQEDKFISDNFPVAPKIWGIGAGLSLNTILSPKALDKASDAGAGFQVWGRYQFNQHVGSQFGLYQHDFSDTSLGITALKYSFLFQTGWPNGFFPFLGIGASINNVNKSQVYAKDYTQLGWQMSLGAHIPSQKLGKRTFFIPQIEFYQVFEKNNGAKAITGLAFLLSLGYFFDAEDFTKNVSLINGK